MKAITEDKIKALSKIRIYALIESTSHELSREIGEFLAGALTRPIEINASGLNIALSFLWSLASRVVRHLESMGEEIIDMEFGNGKTTILTKGGYTISIIVKVRHNQYVSEIEGVVDVEESPFKIEET